MTPQPACPCCGGPIVGTGMRWILSARTLITPAGSVVLSPMLSRLFDVLWRARDRGEILGRTELTARVYADDPDGGPDSLNTVSVHVLHLRDRLAGTGLGIAHRTGRGGGVRLVSREYDAVDDLRASLGEGYRSVKTRMAAGGKAWP